MRTSARAAGVPATTSATITLAVAGEREPLGQGRRDGLHVGPDPPSAHPTLAAELGDHGLHDVAGGREAEALVASALAQDEGVETDQAALHVHERPSAVAGVDGRVGLQVDHRIVRAKLPGEGAHARPW